MFKQKATTYLLEILTIFIGITISFMFDEWRVNQEQRLKQKELVGSILSDLRAKRGELVEDLKANEQYGRSMMAVVEQLDAGQPIPRDTAILAIGRMNIDHWFFGESTPAYTSASATGLWQERPDSLRAPIGMLYYRDFGYLHRLVEKLVEYSSYAKLHLLAPNGLFDQKSNSTEKYQQLMRTEEFRSFMRMLGKDFQFTAEYYRSAIRSIDENLIRLEQFKEGL